MLAELFAVEQAVGRRSAEYFYTRWLMQPELMSRVSQLRREVQQGAANEAVTTLRECFGLEGLVSLGVLHSLKNRLGGAADGAVSDGPIADGSGR